MSVLPSDVSRPRDDSVAGTIRRAVVWIAFLCGLVALLLGSVQIAALIDGTPHPALTIRGSLGELVDLANPSTPVSRIVALAGGLIVMGLLLASIGTYVGSRVLRGSGITEQDQRQKRQLDGARFARHEDLAAVLVHPGEHHNRVVLGTPRGTRRRPTRELVAVEPGHSALVVAPTGQGKTENVMAPAVLDWDGPVVAVSIKRDLYDLTAGWRSQHGEVRVLDPAGLTDPTEVRNAYWTPLSEARSWRAARMLADQMSGVGQRGAQQQGNDAYFAKASGELLAGLFFAAAHCPVPTMQTVSGWLTDPKIAMDIIETLLIELEQDERQPEDVRRNAPYALATIRLRMIGEDPRTVEPIRASAGATIRAWGDYRLGEVTVNGPGVLDPEWLWSDPKRWETDGDQRTLYVIGPDAEQGTYEAMFVGAITQIYNAYARAVQEGRAPNRRLLMVLDEVDKTAPIPKLDTWVTAARGLGINLVIACQNLGQLDTVWGTEKAETIVSGPRVRMFGPGLADRQSLKYIEDIAGQTGVASENESRNPFLFQIATSRQTQTTRQALVPANDASGLAPFTALTFYGNLPPFQVDWRSGHTDPVLKQKQQLTAPGPGDDEVKYLQTPAAERALRLPDAFDSAPAAAPARAPLAVVDLDDDAEDEEDEEDEDAMPDDFAPGTWIADDGPVDDDHHDD